MRPGRAILAAILAVVALLGAPDALRAQAPPSGSYLKTFDNYVVDHPMPLASDATLDIFVHSRDRATWGGLESMAIEHGPNCEAPPATHQSADPMPYEAAVFGCRDHLMTALHAGGYGVIYLTPGHLVDFGAGEAVIRFDVSTFRASTRDWIDVWVTPYEDNLVAPLDRFFPDLQGEPRRAVNVLLGSSNNWATTVYRDFAPSLVQGDWWTGYQTFLVPSASRRDTVEIRLSKTHVKVGMPAYNFWWIDRDIDPPLDWSSGVVQLGHHSYNPEKDCALPAGCKAGTWHWDNVQISPSRPFTMIRANERAAVEASAGAPMAFTFPQAAPEGAHLRAHVYGAGVEVSTDDGTTWAPLRRQPSYVDVPDGGVFEPYWHEIPAGTTAVHFRTTRWGWWGQGGVNYAAIWAESVAQPPTPTAIPPTPTVIPTEVPTATPVDTATPLPTFTPVPPTQVPTTSTPMPEGGCTRVTYRVGQPPLTEGC